jgi:tRNA (guanosine-2'-O-)-methyltransferase
MTDGGLCLAGSRISVRLTGDKLLIRGSSRGETVLAAAEREILDYLREFLTPQRRARFEEVLARRTRMLRVVLEDVYQPYNQSAVLRTAESLGLQDVHIVESSNRLKIARDISLGCDRWLTLHRHRGRDAVCECIAELKAGGFRILAASPHPPATPLDETTVEQPTALVIGHETGGLSPSALELADEHVVIPIRGFVESLNLSVAAALALSHLRTQLEQSGFDWRICADDSEQLRLQWTRNSISNVAAIEARYWQENA